MTGKERDEYLLIGYQSWVLNPTGSLNIKQEFSYFHHHSFLDFRNRVNPLINSTCLVVVKEAKSRESQRPVPAGPDFNSPSVVSTECSARARTLKVLCNYYLMLFLLHFSVKKLSR